MNVADLPGLFFLDTNIFVYSFSSGHAVPPMACLKFDHNPSPGPVVPLLTRHFRMGIWVRAVYLYIKGNRRHALQTLFEDRHQLIFSRIIKRVLQPLLDLSPVLGWIL